MPVVNLKPLATLEGGGGSGGPTSPDDIVGASPTGKTVLTGDALAGRNAIAAAAATDVSALDERVEGLEAVVAAIPAPKTWSTIDGKPPVIAAGTNQANARSAIGAAAASDLGSKADATTVTALASTVANKADATAVAAVADLAATAASSAASAVTAASSKAPIASAALTGSPTAPTPTAGDASNKIATTAFVDTAVDAATLGLVGVAFVVFDPATGWPPRPATDLPVMFYGGWHEEVTYPTDREAHDGYMGREPSA